MRGASGDGRPVVDLGPLGFDGGAHILVKAALGRMAVGGAVAVRGDDPDLAWGLRAWCRREGHRWSADEDGVSVVERGPASIARLVGAERAGGTDPAVPGSVHRQPPSDWGLAARGAIVEAGGPRPRFALSDGDALWTDRATRLYAQGAAGQWDPLTAIEWSTTIANGEDVEAAVVQVMTFRATWPSRWLTSSAMPRSIPTSGAGWPRRSSGATPRCGRARD